MRAFLLTTLALISLPAAAQWADIKRIGTGGESTVATDGKGSVFIAYHQPGELQISRDWGATFTEKHAFTDALGDVHLAAWGEGRVHLAYLIPGSKGIKNYYSFNGGKTMREGTTIAGSLDREWVVPNLRTGEVHLIFSNGYIGGPKSEGIFVNKTTDYGRTFGKPSRVDLPSEDSLAVSPYLTATPNGKLYAAWAVSKDFNNISGFDFAYSTDSGKTWKGHTNLASSTPSLGDTQERWMLGGLVSVGEDRVIAYYHDYTEIDIDGQKHKPLLTYMRISDDGGQSFSKATTVLPMDEIKASIKSYLAAFSRDESYPVYIQTLPWMATDAEGNVHIALMDNRTGQTAVETRVMNRWGVRYTKLAKGAKEFGPSEQVSPPFAAVRPALDYNGCAVDSKYVYITWSENPNSPKNGDYTGDLFLGRKAIGQ